MLIVMKKLKKKSEMGLGSMVSKVTEQMEK